MWQSDQEDGPFLFIQALLQHRAVPTYLRDDRYRDWGSIERYNRVVPGACRPRRRHRSRDQRNVFGWSRAGPIRALP